MKQLKASFEGRWIWLISTFTILLIVVFSCLFFMAPDSSQKMSAILSGLITGLIILLFQIWLSYQELTKMEKWDSLKVIDILPTRDDPNYYRPLLLNATQEIRIFGVTCQRFLDDFVNTEAGAPEPNKILINQLNKGLKVKILIAGEDWLDDNEKPKALNAKGKLSKLSEQYPKQVEFAEYKHEPRHSIMIIDDQAIVGPVFPNLTSKFSPAIHFKKDSKFLKHYLEYFDIEWEKWSKK